MLKKSKIFSRARQNIFWNTFGWIGKMISQLKLMNSKLYKSRLNSYWSVFGANLWSKIKIKIIVAVVWEKTRVSTQQRGSVTATELQHLHCAHLTLIQIIFWRLLVIQLLHLKHQQHWELMGNNRQIWEF